MAIIRWDPFRDMVTLREKMNRLFEDVFTGRAEEQGAHGQHLGAGRRHLRDRERARADGRNPRHRRKGHRDQDRGQHPEP